MNTAARVADYIQGKKEVAQGSTRPNVDPTKTMKAIVWDGKKSVKMEQVPQPIITHAEDAIVKITACSICSGSDGHVYAGEIPNLKPGQILGHEGLGTVVDVGSEVTKFAVGDRVVIAFDIACGKCSYCKRKEFSACKETNDSKLNETMYGHSHAAVFGYGEMLGGVPGSQAEFVRVPFANTNLYKIPENIPDEKALYLSDVLVTSYHATELGEIAEGDTVAIWGLGPIGLLAARWAQIRGASRVIGIDLVPERIALAREKLHIDVIDRNQLGKKSVPEAILELVPEGVDCSIEAAGFRFSTTMKHKVERAVGLETDTSDLLNECFMATRKYGRVSIIADYTGYTNHFAIGTIMFKHLTVRSGQCPCQKYFDTVVKHLEDGSIDPTFLITNRISLEEAPEAYDKLFFKEEGFIKVFIHVG